MNPIERELRGFIRYWTFPVLRPRRFHAYCVGMPKTGTHSLGSVFKNYRSVHEPEIVYYMRIIMEHNDGKMTERQFRERVRYMDRKLWLEFNSSYVNYFLLDALLAEYPDAKFVLSIRDCYSWLDSLVNQLLGREHGEFQRRFHGWYAESLSPGSHQAGDRVFEERGLWPLKSWLQAWKLHNERVLERVPQERLLVVRTHEIRADIPRMAEFLGIPDDSLDASRSHEYQAAEKFGLVHELDESYLEACVDESCRPLMERFFPEVRSLRDVRGLRPEHREAAAGDQGLGQLPVDEGAPSA